MFFCCHILADSTYIFTFTPGSHWTYRYIIQINLFRFINTNQSLYYCSSVYQGAFTQPCSNTSVFISAYAHQGWPISMPPLVTPQYIPFVILLIFIPSMYIFIYLLHLYSNHTPHLPINLTLHFTYSVIRFLYYKRTHEMFGIILISYKRNIQYNQ